MLNSSDTNASQHADKKPSPPANKATSTSTPQAKTAKVKKPGRGFSYLLLLLIMLSCGATAYFGYVLWNQNSTQGAQISQLQAKLGQTSNTAKNVSSANAQLLTQVQKIERAQRDSTAQQQIDLENVHERLNSITGATRQDWLFAEAEYLLRIANQRLFLEKDPATAQSLLEAADQVLAESGDTALMPVRIQIAEELLQLRQQSTGEIDTLLLRLNALANTLPGLTVKLIHPSAQDGTKQVPDDQKIEPAADQQAINNSLVGGWWQSMKNKLSAAMHSLVTIQRKEQRILAPASPEYASYITQNLALRIEQAKLFLMRHRFEDFATSIKGTADWFSGTVTSQSTTARSVVVELRAIAEAKPSTTAVDISGSLNALQKVLEVKYRDHSLEKHSQAKPSTPKQTSVQGEQ